MHDYFDIIRIKCICCGTEFDSFINTDKGEIDPKFCSDTCEKAYYNVED